MGLFETMSDFTVHNLCGHAASKSVKHRKEKEACQPKHPTNAHTSLAPVWRPRVRSTAVNSAKRREPANPRSPVIAAIQRANIRNWKREQRQTASRCFFMLVRISPAARTPLSMAPWTVPSWPDKFAASPAKKRVSDTAEANAS